MYIKKMGGNQALLPNGSVTFWNSPFSGGKEQTNNSKQQNQHTQTTQTNKPN